MEVYKWKTYPKSSLNYGDLYQIKVKPTLTNMKDASAIKYKGKDYFGAKTGSAYGDFMKANPSYMGKKKIIKKSPKKMKKKVTRKVTVKKPKNALNKTFKQLFRFI